MTDTQNETAIQITYQSLGIVVHNERFCIDMDITSQYRLFGSSSILSLYLCTVSTVTETTNHCCRIMPDLWWGNRRYIPWWVSVQLLLLLLLLVVVKRVVVVIDDERLRVVWMSSDVYSDR